MIRDNKIPVFTNINDVPVAPSPTAAGNGSHMIAQYNKHLDKTAQILDFDISSRQRWTASGGLGIYLDLENGDDANSGFKEYIQATNTWVTHYVLSWQRVFDIAEQYCIGGEDFTIYIKKSTSWNLLSKCHFDLTPLKFFGFGDYSSMVVQIKFDSGNNQLIYDNKDMAWLGYDGCPWVIPPLNGRVQFVGWEFISNAYPVAVIGNAVSFQNCRFTASDNAFDCCLYIREATISPLEGGITFKNNTTNGIWTMVLFDSCNIHYVDLRNVLLTSLPSGMALAALNESHIGYINLQNDYNNDWTQQGVIPAFTTVANLKSVIDVYRSQAGVYYFNNRYYTLTDQYPTNVVSFAVAGNEARTVTAINAIINVLQEQGLMTGQL